MEIQEDIGPYILTLRSEFLRVRPHRALVRWGGLVEEDKQYVMMWFPHGAGRVELMWDRLYRNGTLIDIPYYGPPTEDPRLRPEIWYEARPEGEIYP
jgi:hypothetical protein